MHGLSLRSVGVFLVLEFLLLGLLKVIGDVPAWVWFATSAVLILVMLIWDRWIKPRIHEMPQIQVFLLIGLIGTWLFTSLALGTAVWIILTNQRFNIAAKTENDGPIQWYSNLTMEGGLPQGRNVFSLQFHGANVSQKEIALKSANIVSAINGSKIGLEIIAQNEIVQIDQINLVPAGAPVQLVAKFGPFDPNNPEKNLGISPKAFLETWRQFNLIVEDEVRTYRVPFNEAHLMPFFPGMVGPHVTKKIQ